MKITLYPGVQEPIVYEDCKVSTFLTPDLSFEGKRVLPDLPLTKVRYTPRLKVVTTLGYIIETCYIDESENPTEAT